MRTLLIGALAATLVGCSHQPPPRAAISLRSGPNALVRTTTIRQRSKLATTEGKSDIAVHRDRLALAHAHPAAHLAGATTKSSEIAANAGTASPMPPSLAQTHVRAAGSAAATVAARTNIPGPHPIVGAPSTKTIQEQVAAATVVAERMTIATTLAALKDRDRSNQSKTTEDGDAKATTASANKIDLPVALLMARSDIKSVSELTGKTIAIESRYSAYNRSVRAAIVEAGAPEVQLSEDQATAINRLVSGEVPAAVLALVSAEAAENFPEIAGFRIFHVPLSPRFLWDAQ